MSTDWNVHCLDCKSTHTFDDANHQVEAMAVLCKYASAIASLAPLVRENPNVLELRLGHYGEIDVFWFADHHTHRLIPINEYGAILGQCVEYVDCGCGSRRRCTLDHGHDGAHDPTQRTTTTTTQ